MGEELGINHIDQPFVAHRAGKEDRVAFQHHHVQAGVKQAQMLGSRHPAPTTAADHHPLARRLGQQGVGLHVDQERQRAARLGQSGPRTQGRTGGEKLASIESHVDLRKVRC